MSRDTILKSCQQAYDICWTIYNQFLTLQHNVSEVEFTAAILFSTEDQRSAEAGLFKFNLSGVVSSWADDNGRTV
jgi:hypothetical protein